MSMLDLPVVFHALGLFRQRSRQSLLTISIRCWHCRQLASIGQHHASIDKSAGATGQVKHQSRHVVRAAGTFRRLIRAREGAFFRDGLCGINDKFLEESLGKVRWEYFFNRRSISKPYTDTRQGKENGRRLTTCSNGIETNAPWYAEGREALYHADHGRFAAQIGISGSWVSQEARSASRSYDLTLAALISTIVALVEQLHEGEGRVVQGCAIQIVNIIKFGHGRFPGVLDKVGKGVARLEIFEHRSGHAGVANEHIDIADILFDTCGYGFEVILGSNVAFDRDDDTASRNVCQPDSASLLERIYRHRKTCVRRLWRKEVECTHETQSPPCRGERESPS